MRRIIIKKWKAQTPEGEKEVDTLFTLDRAIAETPSQNWPRGMANVLLFGKLREAFEDAKITGILKLEEEEYRILKSTIESNIPAPWGMSKPITEALKAFFDAKEEKP